MSLLQRLAERALGVAEPPLRSQRAVLAPQAVEAHAEPASPAVPAPVPVAVAPQAPVLRKLEDHDVSAVPHPPAPNVSPVIAQRPVLTMARAAPAAAVFASPAADEPPRVLQTAPHVTSMTVMNTLMPGRPRHTESIDMPARTAAQPAPTSTDTPAPLLPAQPPDTLPLLGATPPLASRPEHHDTRRRGPAQENVTEVHVSIGRVELTALAASPAAARSTQRSREPSRSLADYLRPPGHGKGQGSS
jgi:hypothetical protein